MSAGNEPLSVSQAVGIASKAVSSLPTLAVIGEVTGFRGPNARSGHCYFSVKDPSSSMDCIVWKGVYESSGVALRDGLEVLLYGKFDVYQASGKMSFKATRLAATGEGVLRQKIAELARKLSAEGLMDDSRKRPIPRFCDRVCVVTSLSGEVIDDVKRTLARRNPMVEIDCVGCAVQGAHAPATIVRALEVAAAAKPDCILLVRGGGALEELMAFNDEAVARAVAACPVPVVTGIGHEPDVTICDMVSDRRCSTPTGAAESVAPALDEVVAQINARQARLTSSMTRALDADSQVLEALGHRVALAARQRVSTERARIDALAARPCLTDPRALVTMREQALLMTEQRLLDSLPHLIDRRASELDSAATRFAAAGRRLVRPYRDACERDAKALEALSPLKVLGRGYAIVRDASGSVVSDAQALAAGDDVSVLVGTGSIDARVTATHPASD